jgi:hypothetical protein
MSVLGRRGLHSLLVVTLWTLWVPWPIYGGAEPIPLSRINLTVKTQLEAIIRYSRDAQILVPISSWIDGSHHACRGVGIEETLYCEIEVLQSHCRSQAILNQESCFSLADHYASLYINRKIFLAWKSRDSIQQPNAPFERKFHLERLRNRFVSLRKVLEMIAPACKSPWTADCEVERLTQFCTEYQAQTAFPWPACVSGILESWRI